MAHRSAEKCDAPINGGAHAWRAALTFLALAWLALQGAPVAAQTELAIYTGVAHTQRSTLVVDQAATSTHAVLDGVAFSGHSLSMPLYYGVRAGRFLGHIGFEGEFTHLKIFAADGQSVAASGAAGGAALAGPTPLASVVQHFAISHGVNLLLMNVAAREHLPLAGNAHQHVYGTLRAGVGTTIPHTESIVMGRQHEGYQWGRPAFQLSSGLEAPLKGPFGIFAEYKFTRTHQHNNIANGTADVTLRSHHFVIGARWLF